jgi:hypothetical protein
MSRFKLKRITGDVLGAALSPDNAYQLFEDCAQQLTLEDRWQNDDHAKQSLTNSYYHPTTNRHALVHTARPHDPVTLHNEFYRGHEDLDQETKNRNCLPPRGRGGESAMLAGRTGKKAEIVRLLNEYD